MNHQSALNESVSAATVGHMSHIDGCPECVRNAETPSSVHNNAPHGWLANYVCADCGHAWTTSWKD